MKRVPLKIDAQSGIIAMSVQNLKICVKNQDGYQQLHLNDSLQLQHYNFRKIQNLSHCLNPILNEPPRNPNIPSVHPIPALTQQQKEHNSLIQKYKTNGVNTIFLNNNVIGKIQNLQDLGRCLVTLNLAYNNIQKFQGLAQLHMLRVLDLANNSIRQVESSQTKGLLSLNRLNLSANLISNATSMQGLLELSNTLQILQLHKNPLSSQQCSQTQLSILSLLSKLQCLKLLSLKETQFSRLTPSYRKQTIYHIKSLNFLDDRPVTQQQRFMVSAWKKGGIKEERQARKVWQKKGDQINNKIMQEYQQSNRQVQAKVRRIYYIKGKQVIQQLQKLTTIKQNEDFQLKDDQYQLQVNLKIEQNQKYLQLLMIHCRGLDLDKQLGLSCANKAPLHLIQNRTSECIYIYNVSQSQLQAIKKKYYPQQPLPLIARSYSSPQQLLWLQQYDEMLNKLYQLHKGKWELIAPSFNMDVYEFDQKARRGLRRFRLQQLKEKYNQIRQQEIYHTTQYQCNSSLNQDYNSLQQKNSTRYANNALDMLD